MELLRGAFQPLCGPTSTDVVTLEIAQVGGALHVRTANEEELAPRGVEKKGGGFPVFGVIHVHKERLVRE